MRGSIPYTEVASVLREHDAFILLSDFEGLPLSLLEAMAEGVVPVVSDLPSGIREVVTPSTGVRVPTGDVEAAARAIEELASNREHLAALAKEAQLLARAHYNAERMVERFMTLIEDLGSPPFEEAWPEKVSVPTPLMLRHPWLFTGTPRRIRRLIKRLNL
jgi:glycosyltransferase involved in cell wall biosynthesis